MSKTTLPTDKYIEENSRKVEFKKIEKAKTLSVDLSKVIPKFSGEIDNNIPCKFG